MTTPARVDPEMQERLKAQLFDLAHVSMWACDRDLRVVLWNRGASEIYGLTGEEILGERFVDHFVDEAEASAAIEDCRKTIDVGKQFRNFLAYDRTPAGDQRYMLTNCFRIVDPLTGVRYQAEIAVEIGDLGQREREHRTLRELSVERLTETRISLNRSRDELMYRIGRLQTELAGTHAEIARELESFQGAGQQRTRASVEAAYRRAQESLEREHEHISADLDRIRIAALKARTLEEVGGLDAEVGSDPTTWTERLRRAAPDE
jgi:PAS domain S-box-containing protein